MHIQNKTVVITGASGGLGEQIAIASAKKGANVILLARNMDKLKKVQSLITSTYHVSCQIKYLDVSNATSVSTTFDEIMKEEKQIDILVNNAGFGVFDLALEASMEDITGMIETNVLGLIACTKKVLPHFTGRKNGHIINIASQAGKIATPKSSVYSATKHAVLGFSNSLRMELAEFNVFVTTVNPGPIATNFFNIADKSGNYVNGLDKMMLDPEKLANRIVDSFLTNKREINAPNWMNAGSKLYMIFPRLVERVARRAFFKK